MTRHENKLALHNKYFRCNVQYIFIYEKAHQQKTSMWATRDCKTAQKQSMTCTNQVHYLQIGGDWKPFPGVSSGVYPKSHPVWFIFVYLLCRILPCKQA